MAASLLVAIALQSAPLEKRTALPPPDYDLVPGTAEAEAAPGTSASGREDGLKQGRCTLQVSGKDYIAGDCLYRLESDGSFFIRELRGPDYFAQVTMNGASAEAYWNGQKGASHAHAALGQVSRSGACWVNQKARICLWAK